jgi:hypothetical protein
VSALRVFAVLTAPLWMVATARAADPVGVWAAIGECKHPADMRCTSSSDGETSAWACTATAEKRPLLHDDCPGWTRLVREQGLYVKQVSEGGITRWTLAAGPTEDGLEPSPASARAIDRVADEPTAIERELLNVGLVGRYECADGACGLWVFPDEVADVRDIVRSYGWVVQQEEKVARAGRSATAFFVSGDGAADLSHLWAQARAGASHLLPAPK